MTTRLEALKRATADLEAAGVPTPRLDAEVLLAAALGQPRNDILLRLDAPLATGINKRFEEYLQKRRARMPVARILGKREFWGLEFIVSTETLDPRPDSETLIEALLRAVDMTPAGRGHAWRLLDLGTGTGCLAIAALSELGTATAFGIDIANGAIQTANENAEALGFATRFNGCVMDWSDSLSHLGPFDYILANPPYVPDIDRGTLAPEVAGHDPEQALFGGDDGLVCYPHLLDEAKVVLTPGGMAFFEVGVEQADAVSEMAKVAGYVRVEQHMDLAGVPRVVAVTKGA